ncbi:DNA mismatch repair protein MutS [Lachnospiraceae bacterium A10]|nr:DNA mismatch repair protein MutS [Lachnospiraceae bacterium A10]
MKLTEKELAQITPMMQHYLQTKEENPGCILFYRLGDFYEMFFDDAILVSKELEITLTGKSCGLEERAPMCGVPFHAAETYLTRLVSKGYKVAICEQVEDPKMAKGMVKREVVRVVTPGTNLDSGSLDETKNNYLMAIVYMEDSYGITIADVTTGDCFVTEVDSERKLMDELNKYSPSEIICNEAFYVSGVDVDSLRERRHIVVSALESYYFEDNLARTVLLEHFHVKSLDGLGIIDFPIGIISAGALFKYLIETQKSDLSHMNRITPYRSGNFMMIDGSTRRNLELVETLREKEKRGSLLWVLDKTKTAMGARLLRSYIEQPLIQKSAIEARLDAITEMNQHLMTREELREYLNPVYDLERLITRIVYKTANPRDLISFRNSISVLPAIKNILEEFEGAELKKICLELDTLTDLYQLIFDSIQEEPPISIHDGDILKEGFNEEVDELRRAKTEGKQWLAELEAKEKEKTGIKTLKIKYNKVFGYYLEVTNSFKDQVPDYFIRKQTLTNAERFYTPELKELENKIMGSEDRLTHLENEYYNRILDKISSQVSRIQSAAKDIAKIDVYQSLAYVAEKNHYCRPKMNDKGKIDIKKGRHPVVEKMIPNDMFIDNDTYLDSKDHRVSIITGPNMAGKSTYMRQTALIVLMAQIGSFVPAEEANIGVVDRIFTRVGASDDLASGQSTFMVEMNEVANILRNATSNSLLILDEIGRGTSTFDGLSIAWAVVEYIADIKIIGAKTLFATHYHELTELEGKISGVNNFCIAVKENGDDIVFLRKIVPGGADKSYGIQVAKLAGLPDAVIERSKEIVNQLVENDVTGATREIASKKTENRMLDEVDMNQMSLFDTISDEDILNDIRALDISNMTPMEAMNKLNEIQNKVINRW